MQKVVQRLCSRGSLPGIVLSLLWLLIVVSGTVHAQRGWEGDPQLQAAVLKEDWLAVVKLLGADETLPPLARLLKAHALLALNKNNESLCLFLGVASMDDRRQWEQWTQAFAKKYPDRAIAHYFRGDALARLEQWAGAVKAFDTALALRPTHPLALNARGVTYAIKEQWNAALADFHAAAKTQPTFADAYASRGAMYIQKKAGAQGALKGFEQALGLSPDFGLALQGRGAAKFALRQWDEAQRDFAAAQQKTACVSGMVEENLVRVVQYMQGLRGGVQLAGLADEGVGTPVDKRFDDLKKNPSQWNMNRFNDSVQGLSLERQTQYFNKLKDYAAQNPQWGNTVNTRLENIKDWNRPGGWGEKGSSVLPKEGGITLPNGGGMNAGGSRLQEHQLGVTRHNFDTATRMQNTLGSERPLGGVTTNLGKAHVDEGDWPVVAHYGLLYRVQSHERSADEKGGKQ